MFLQSIYDEMTSISMVVNDGNLCTYYIEAFYDRMVNALTMAGLCVPRKKVSFFKHWWDIQLSELKEKSVSAHRVWVSAGKPKQGKFFSEMYKARAAYKSNIKQKEKQSQYNFSDELNDALLSKDFNRFWQSWNSKFGRTGAQVKVVDGHASDSEIADAFKHAFSAACNYNNLNVHVVHEMEFKSNLLCYDLNCDVPTCSVEDVEKALNEIKIGKAPGADNLTAEHIRYAHPVVMSCIKMLFNWMIHASYVPDAFGVGIMIPVKKSNDADSTNSDNYRGITLSPMISKLFEYVLLDKFGKFLKSSDLQFGFKKGLGCSDALFTLKNVINYFINNGSTITMAALDISKAFDKVSQYGLFLKLLERRVPVVFVNILVNWYTKCSVCVKWGTALSTPFTIRAGVRQGGILSPVLFAIYMEDFTDVLKINKLGCTINKQYFGCILYADDIMLLSQSVTCLQRMLDVCAITAVSLDLKFNIKKSKILRIGCRWNQKCDFLILDNQELEMVPELKYLGMVLIAGAKIACSYREVKKKFYRTLNGLLSKLKLCSSECIALNLMKSYCVPFLLFGCEAIPPSGSMMRSLDNLVQRAVARIFNATSSMNIGVIRVYCGLTSLHTLAAGRVERFVRRFRCKALSFLDALLWS
jgi:hypothetical protein